jgi:hypothetical protein
MENELNYFYTHIINNLNFIYLKLYHLVLSLDTFMSISYNIINHEFVKSKIFDDDHAHIGDTSISRYCYTYNFIHKLVTFNTVLNICKCNW